MAKKPEKGGDELDMLKASLLKKDLDVITITDKMRRLEDRSQFIVGSMEKLSVGAREKIVALTDIVDFLTNEGNTKDNRIAELEAACQKAEQDLKDNTAKMNKQMADLTSAHEFQLNSMKLKLEAAQVRIREMADFSLKKKAIEDENAALKEQLLKEQRDHAEAISDVERVSVQEKERLKKEIQTRVAETKKEMSNTLKEQLHSKTKRTIIENEQLKKEVGYHTYQTEMLVHQNQKLIDELAEVLRNVQLSKELEDDLARRNHMYQQTTRVLVYKLREAKKNAPGSKNGAIQGKMNGGQTKGSNNTDEDQATKITPRTEAIKFLYACLEDIEQERLAKLPVSEPTSKHGNDANLSSFTLKQRQSLLMALFQQAMSLRSATDNMTKHLLQYPNQAGNKPHSAKSRSKVRVDDILAMPIEDILESVDENKEIF